MARPTKFDPLIARLIVAHIGVGATNAHAAGAAGLAPRSLQNWLSRGRRGEPPFGDFAGRFDRIAERVRRARVSAHYEREAARAKARWQAFKASREAWYIERLGPIEFWARRLAWCDDRGKERGADRARVELVAAIRAEQERRGSAGVIA